MGNFDTIIIKEITCPKCKKKINHPDGQTKHHCSLNEFRKGDYFDLKLRYIDVYTFCTDKGCDYWIDYFVRIDKKGCITDDYAINYSGEEDEIPDFPVNNPDSQEIKDLKKEIHEIP